MAYIRNENYIFIGGWMINELHLKGTELLVYAIIYSFTQAENQVFSGSLKYLAEWTNSSKQTVQNNLKSLVEKGLIQKNSRVINGVNFVEYYTNNLDGVYKKFDGGIQKTCIGGMQKICPNIQTINIQKDNTKDKEKKFTPPTVEEVRAFCEERKNGIDAEAFISFYQSKNWFIGKNKMVDWRAAVRTWELKRKVEVKHQSYDLEKVREQSTKPLVYERKNK